MQPAQVNQDIGIYYSLPIRSRISRRLFCAGGAFELMLFDFGSFFEFLICISSILILYIRQRNEQYKLYYITQ